MKISTIIPNVPFKDFKGFAKTCNEAARKTDGEILIFKNADLQVKNPGASEWAWVKAFERDSKLGILGAKLVFPNGKVQFAGGWMNWMEGIHYGRNEQDGQQFDSPFYCPWVTGAFMAVRRECFKHIGGFDERYFFMCEDHALCLDAWEKGWKVLYDPTLVAVHEEGGVRNRLKPLEKEKIGIESSKAKRIFLDECWNRPLNETYQKIWKANKETIPETEKEKVLILERTGAIGDVVFLTSILESLKANYPETMICVRTEWPEVLKRNPNVSIAAKNVSHPLARVVTLNMAHESRPNLNPAQAAVEELKAQGFDCEVRQIQVFSDLRDWMSLMSRHEEFLEQRYAVIHPSHTHWKNRNLPNVFWAELIHGIKETGLLPVIVGTMADKLPENPGVYDLRGQTTLQEVRELIIHAQVFVGADSMPLHVAQSTPTPRIGVFTSVNPKTRLLTTEPPNYSVGPKNGCIYCMDKQNPPVRSLECPENRDYECTKSVDVKDVLEKVKEILK